MRLRLELVFRREALLQDLSAQRHEIALKIRPPLGTLVSRFVDEPANVESKTPRGFCP
ncbi:unnamed protein product, partial [Phaeothamnion confervicola]